MINSLRLSTTLAAFGLILGFGAASASATPRMATSLARASIEQRVALIALKKEAPAPEVEVQDRPLKSSLRERAVIAARRELERRRRSLNVRDARTTETEGGGSVAGSPLFASFARVSR
jgi:hypothetical protein